MPRRLHYRRWRYYIDGVEVTQKEAEKQIRMNYVAVELQREDIENGRKTIYPPWATYRIVRIEKD